MECTLSLNGDNVFMPVDLTPYILPQFNVLRSIPQETLSEIRNQSASGEAQIRLGDLMVSIRPMSIEGFFIGSINQSGLDENSLQIAFNHIEYLECELNRGGLSSREVEMLRGIEIQNNISLFSKSWSRSLLDRIELCAFNVESAELNAPERSRTCPVTLCEPETGVFMKNSNSSNVCSLYDKAALIHLIDIKAHHPLSRESITTSMIIGKDECHFDSKIEAFVASDT